MPLTKRLALLLFCVFATALLPACSKPVELKLRLQPGDKRVVEITNDLTTTVTVMGNPQTQPMKSILRYTYEVEGVDTADTATVKVTTDLTSMMDQFTGNAGAAMGNPFSEIGEITLTMKLASDGTVQSVEGMDAVAEKMIKSMKKTMENLPPQAQAMMNGQNMSGMFDGMKKMMGDEAMRKQMQPLTAIYPPEPVRVGSTWTKKFPLAGPLPMTATMTYTVTARGNGVMNIAFEGDISSGPGGGLDMGVMKMDLDLSGKQSGTLQVDEATGWVTASTTETDMTGEMKIKGMAIPMKTSGTVYMTTRAE